MSDTDGNKIIMHKLSRTYYWTSLFISVCVMLLSFGIGLMALGIIILPIVDEIFGTKKPDTSK